MTEKLSKIERLKKKLMSWGSALLVRIRSIDLKSVAAFVIEHKSRILIVLILIYAGNKAYDHFFSDWG